MTDSRQTALEAVEYCLKVIHNERIPKEDNAIWSSGSSAQPRITEDILETIRAALQDGGRDDLGALLDKLPRDSTLRKYAGFWSVDIGDDIYEAATLFNAIKAAVEGGL